MKNAQSKTRWFFKILFYTREGSGSAGYEVRSDALTKVLRERGLCSSLISFKKYHPDTDEIILSVFKKILLNMKAFIDFLKIRPGMLVLQRVNYHFPAALLYYLIFKPALVLDTDDWESRENIKEYFFGITNSMSVNMLRLVSSMSRTTVVSSAFLKTYLVPYAKRIELIPSGIDEKKFYKAKRTVQPFSCVWCGSVEKKQHGVLLEIKEMIEEFTNKAGKNIRLTLIARGGLIDELALFIKGINNPCITLISGTRYEKMPRLLEQHQIGLLPLFKVSKFNLAKSPVKLFEYMASGLISVVSDTGEAGGIIEDNKNGFIVKSNIEMIERINSIAVMPYDEIEKIILNSQKSFMEKFSLSACADKWIKILKPD